jgi:hypothetical protein
MCNRDTHLSLSDCGCSCIMWMSRRSACCRNGFSQSSSNSELISISLVVAALLMVSEEQEMVASQPVARYECVCMCGSVPVHDWNGKAHL